MDFFGKTHLRQVGQSYWSHHFFALKWGFVLIGAGLASIVHGLIPSLFPFYAPRTVRRISKMIIDRNIPGENEAE